MGNLIVIMFEVRAKYVASYCRGVSDVDCRDMANNNKPRLSAGANHHNLPITILSRQFIYKTYFTFTNCCYGALN